MTEARLAGRGWHGGLRPWDRSRKEAPGLATLIVGAGSAARTLMRDLRNCPDYGLRPAGLLDDDPGIMSVFGTPVLGGLADLRRVVRDHQIQAIIIAIPSLPPAELSLLVRAAADTGAHVRYLPSFLSALERAARAADMRTVSYSDLLGRAERKILESSVQEMLAGARVLVTGAGGSIGQELCRQIRSHDPASLHMLDHDESNMHTLQLELNGRALLDSAEIIIADIRDETRIRQVFRSVRPDVVFHAAAHKHLPLLEQHPGEGVKTNVLGTQNVVRAAAECGTGRFVHHLEQRVEHVRVGLLDLVEQHHRIRTPPHGLSQLPALVVADVSGGRTDETRDRVLLHVLGHVDPHHRVLRVEHELGERASELCLADAGRAEEQERADRAIRILQAGARAAQRCGDRLDRLVLADDALVKTFLHVHELVDLALHQARDRDAGPLGDDFRDVFGVDVVLEELRLGVGRCSAASAASSCFSRSGIVPY